MMLAEEPLPTNRTLSRPGLPLRALEAAAPRTVLGPVATGVKDDANESNPARIRSFMVCFVFFDFRYAHKSFFFKERKTSHFAKGGPL